MKQIVLEKTGLIKLLVYGEAGTGKTTLVGSFQEDPRSSPLLVLDCGGQPISLRFLDPPPLVVSIESTKDLNPPYNWFAEGQPWDDIVKGTTGAREDPFCQAVYDYFDGEPGKFKTIAIDGISDLQQTCVREISEQPTRPGDRPKLVQLGHWGTVRQQTNNIVALTDHRYIEAFGRTEYSPLLNTKSAMESPAKAQIVGRMMNVTALSAREKQDVKKVSPNAFCVLRMAGDADFAAKWQGVLDPPRALFDPTASAMLDIIERE